jgi:circadian clock protein KaiC
MFGGKGYFRGSSILASGTPGTGKTTLAAHFAEGACTRGERCLYFAFEESPAQILRNTRSVGINLDPFVKKGLLRIHSSRPTLQGLEMHLVVMTRLIATFNPKVVVVDPVTNLVSAGLSTDVKSMLTRLIDDLKTRQVTTLLTSLTPSDGSLEMTDIGVSSLMDTWIILRHTETRGERSRGLMILTSRGMAHANQVQQFHLTGKGLTLDAPVAKATGKRVGSRASGKSGTISSRKADREGNHG